MALATRAAGPDSKHEAFAPGLRVEIRDAEWVVKRADLTSNGTHSVLVTGISELVRSREARFLTELDPIKPLHPEVSELVPDASSQFADTRLYLESLLRQSPPTSADLWIGHQAAIDVLPSVIGSSSQSGAPILSACQPAFRELSSRGFLTVRAIAQRLIEGDEPPLVASAVPDPALLNQPHVIWTPASNDVRPSEKDEAREGFVRSVSGTRLGRAEQLLPGVTKAVQQRLASSLESEAVKQRLLSQLDGIADTQQKALARRISRQ